MRIPNFARVLEMWPYKCQVERSDGKCVSAIVKLSIQHANKSLCFRANFVDVIRSGEVVLNR